MELTGKTTGIFLKENASRLKNNTAIEYGSWKCSWAELDEVTDLLAARFMSLYGIHTGSHVGIWSLNSPAFVQTVPALYKIGAVAVVFNTANSVDEMADQLELSDTSILFYGPGSRGCIFDQMIPAIRKKAPGVQRFIHIEEKEAENWLMPSSFTAEERRNLPVDQVACILKDLPADSPACIIFTSGTTSRPKAVVLTHYGIVNVNLRMKKWMRWNESDKAIIAVSLYHGFGLNAGLGISVVAGMTMHVVPSFRTGDVWDAIDKYRCTVMLGVPSMYLALVRKAGNEKYDESALRSGLVGGSVISTEEYREICRRFPKMHLVPSFGMTEASTASSFSDYDDPLRSGGVSGGEFFEDTMARIRDLATGEIVGWTKAAAALYNGEAHGRSGELELAGFNLFKEYYKNPEATAEAYTEDGWLKTGDVGYINDYDEICLTGRKKELIIRSGENISPREIEEAILESGMSSQVKVVGVPSEYTQEEICACLVPADAASFDASALVRFLRKKLSYFKVPKYILCFSELPMTASGKIKIGQLKETAAGYVTQAEALEVITDSSKGKYYFRDVTC